MFCVGAAMSEPTQTQESSAADFHAQDSLSRDSVQKQTVSAYRIDTVVIRRTDKEKKVDGFAILAFVLSVCSLGGCVYLFLMNKRSNIQNTDRLNSYEEKANAGEKQITTIEQSVGEINQRVARLSERIEKVEITIRPNLSNDLSKYEKKQKDESAAKMAGANKSEVVVATKKTEILYAQARQQGGMILLTAFGKEKKDFSPFLLTINGDQCTVSFNNDSFAKVKSSIESKVISYVDCIISTKNTPTQIVTLQAGKAVRQGGNLWKMETKPKLEIK